MIHTGQPLWLRRTLLVVMTPVEFALCVPYAAAKAAWEQMKDTAECTRFLWNEPLRART